MVKYFERADLLRNADTNDFFVLFKQKKYKLKAKNWEKAEKEGNELLNKLFPTKQIILD